MSIIVPLCLQMILVMSTFLLALKNPYRFNLTVENLIDILFFFNLSYSFMHASKGNILSSFLNDCLVLTFCTVLINLIS